MYKNNSGLIAKTKICKYKKKSAFNRKVSAFKSATILILDRSTPFEKNIRHSINIRFFDWLRNKKTSPNQSTIY